MVKCRPLRQELNPLNVLHWDVTWDREHTRCGAVDVDVVSVHVFGIEHDDDVDVDSLSAEASQGFSWFLVVGKFWSAMHVACAFGSVPPMGVILGRRGQ